MTSATATTDRIVSKEKVSNDSRGLVALLCGMLLLGYIVLREMIGGGDLPPVETPVAESTASAQPSEPAEPTPHALRPVGSADGLLIPAPMPDAPPQENHVEGDLANHEELLPLFPTAGEITPTDELLPANPLRLGNRPDDPRWR